MVRSVVTSSVFLATLALTSAPAYAINLRIEASADCDGYAITVVGRTISIPYDCAFVAVATDANGEQVVVEGEFLIDPRGTPTDVDPEITFTGDWGGLPCGDWVFTIDAIAFTEAVPPPESQYFPEYPMFEGSFESAVTNCACPPGPGPGTGTPGYWKNHPEAWPVAEIEVGCVVYSRDDAIAIMGSREKGNKLYTIYRALVSAKLNVLIGNDSSCVDATIAAAEEWLCTYGPIGENVVQGGGEDSPWRTGEPLYLELDDYNNGLLCAEHRD